MAVHKDKPFGNSKVLWVHQISQSYGMIRIFWRIKKHVSCISYSKLIGRMKIEQPKTGTGGSTGRGKKPGTLRERDTRSGSES